MVKWQQNYLVDWDATDGRNGGARRAVWEVLMEMERFNGKAKAEEQGAVALVVDLAKAFERVSLLVVWAWATHPSFPLPDLAGAVRLFRAPEVCTVRRMCGRTAHNHHCCLARVQVELFAFLRIVLQDALSEATNICPPPSPPRPLKLSVFVDDITALVKGKK